MHTISIARAIASTLLVIGIAACSDATPPTESPIVHSVVVTPSVKELQVGATEGLHASLRDPGGRLINGRSVSWSSDREDVATVSTTGTVSAIAPGTAVITATSEGKSGSAVIQVPANLPPPGGNPPGDPAVITDITLDALQVTLDEGNSHFLNATPRNSNGDVVTGPASTWTSNDESVARVQVSGAMRGTVTGVRPGSAIITVTVHGKSASATVTVTADHPYDLTYVTPEGSAPARSAMYRIDISQPVPQPLRMLASAQMVGTPAFSPDGKKVAFTINNENLFGLFLMNVDGTGYRQLTYGNDYWPAWSPDGTRIAFTRHPQGEEPEIWLLDLDQPMPTKLTSDSETGLGAMFPAWSPVPVDGSHRIAFTVRTGAKGHIYTMKPDGSDRRQVTSGDVLDIQAAFSPDGSRMAFIRTAPGIHADPFVVNVATGQVSRLGLALAGTASAPTWSPDGLLIAFASEHDFANTGVGPYQIYTIRADGTLLAQRTFGSGSKTGPRWILRD